MRTSSRPSHGAWKCGAILLAFAIASATCGQRSLTVGRDATAGADDGGMPDGASTGGGSGNRVPQNHRPVASICATERATRPVPNSCLADGGAQATTRCLRDADCLQGANGRCSARSNSCTTNCSYDACMGDADCGVQVPCSCRTSPSSFANNWCLSNSNCAVDADCGPSGYCSPSLVGVAGDCFGCGLGYFCHTPSDQCVDDADCAAGVNKTCAFNLPSGRWSCASVGMFP